MNGSITGSTTRRRFFAGVLRVGALGVIGAGSVLAMAKRYRLKRRGICLNGGLCRDCEVFEDCRLPLARSARRLFKRGGQ